MWMRTAHGSGKNQKYFTDCQVMYSFRGPRLIQPSAPFRMALPEPVTFAKRAGVYTQRKHFSSEWFSPITVLNSP